jgi:hypothetical protein
VATALPIEGRTTPDAGATLRIGLLGPILLVRGDQHLDVTGPKGSACMLSSEHVDVDVARFDRLATEARRLLTTDPATALEHLSPACELQERPAALLMRALYRTGRQTDACAGASHV